MPDQPVSKVARAAMEVTSAPELAQVLRQLRRREARQRGGRDLTYRELAALTGWSRGVIGDYLTGKVLPPVDRFDSLVRLLGAGRAEFGVLATARDRIEERRRGEPPSAGQPPPYQLPPDVATFTGRTGQLARLDTVLDAARDQVAVPVVAVVGTAGVGKTALTVHWAHRVRDRFPDGQLYVNLHGYATATPLRPIDALAPFLRALGVPAQEVPVEEQEATARYRTLLADQRVLVVLDNARAAEQVRPLLPSGPGCLVLVTSRDRLDGLVAHHDARRLTLDALPPAEAHRLLVRTIDADHAAADSEALAELARRCAYLPLALRLAAANLATRRDQVAEYAARLAAGNPLAGLAVAGDDDHSAVRTAFGLSYTTLPGDAARLFRLLGVLPGADVPVSGAAALADTSPEDAARLLDRLAAAHLVHETAPGRFAFHDLLRHYATELAAAGPAAERTAARDRLYAWYLDCTDAAARLLYPHRLRLPAPDRRDRTPAGWSEPTQAMAWLEAERPNLVAAVQHAAVGGPRPATWLLADTLRGYLSVSVHMVDWDTVCRAGLAAAEAEGDLAAQAAGRLSLAELHWRQERHLAAIDLYQQAVKLSEQAGWPAGTAAAAGNLGVIYREIGRGEAAVEYYSRAMELNRRLGRHAGQANQLTNLGITYFELGQLDKAAECSTEALELYQGIGSRVARASCQCNLGEVCLALGDLERAQAYLTAALDLLGQIGKIVAQAETLRLLAEVHRAAGRLGTAREAAGSAIDIARETSARRIEALALHTLGNIELSAGRPGPATARQREALQLAREIGIPYPEGLAHLGLANIYHRFGRLGPAAAHAGQALTIAQTHGYRMLEDHAVALLAELPPASGAG